MARCKILIIDDDTDDVEILAEAFTQSGVDGIHYVHTVIQAFMYLQSLETPEELPKLIVTDLYLPGITGSEFLKDLKQMEKYRDIHVIVLTSTKTDKEIEKYKQLGAIDYLIKPSSYDEYVEVVDKISQRINFQ